MHLFRDPYVANRVRVLDIRENSRAVSAGSYMDRVDRFSQLVHKISSKVKRRPPKDDQLIIRIITNLVLCLPNVITLRVHARSAIVAPLYQPIFDAVWKTFGANLRSVTLTGYIHHLPNLLLAP